MNSAAAQHGGLMVVSFLASLIFLERAVSFKTSWPLWLPAINVLSGVAFVLDAPVLAHWLMVTASMGFVVMCIYFVYRFEELFYFIFLAGAFCLAGGNLVLMLTRSYPTASTWWMGFLLFTIVGERLELTRFLNISNTKKYLLVFFLVIVLASLFWPFHLGGHLVFAFGILLTALWLLRYDMARHSIKHPGQHRYSGLLLIAGYLWLLVMATLMLFQHDIPFGYDAVLHSFFIGFVFSIIFSHAPIILPSITRSAVKIYSPVLYLWFILLQLSLVLRITGDVTGDLLMRKLGGIINGVVILLFFITIVFLFVRGRVALERSATK
jgi:hypothetical protein